MAKLNLSSRVLIAPVDSGDAVQKLEPTAQSLFDFIDENAVPLEGRIEPNISRFIEGHKKEFPGATGVGIRGGPQVVQGQPVPTEPSAPRLARAGAAGLVRSATIGLVNLPDLPEETTSERMLRGMGQVIGAAVPFGLTLKGARIAGLGRKGLFATGAGLGVAESRLRDENPSVARDIFAAGLAGTFMALAGPAKAADVIRNITIREPLGTTSLYRGFPNVNRILSRARLKDIPEDERELARMYQSLSKSITPGEVQFDDLVNVVRRMRAGEKLSDDLVIAPIDTPALARIMKGAGLTGEEIRTTFNVPSEAFARRFGAAGRPVGTFRLGRFGRVEDAVPRTTTVGNIPSVETPGLAVGDDAAAKIRTARQSLDGEQAKDAFTTTRATEQVVRTERPTVSAKEAIDDIVPPSGAADRPLPGTVTTPTGRVLTEGEALARRGKPKRAAPLGSVEREVVGSKGIGKTSVRYISKETGEEVGRAIYVRLKPTKEGAQVVSTNEVIPTTVDKAEFLIEVVNPAPGFSEAIIMDLRAAGGRFIRGQRSTIRGISRRLGGRKVEGVDDIIEFENLRVPRGGAPSDDFLRIGDVLKGIPAKEEPIARGAKILGITPRQHVFADIEEATRDAVTGISKLPLRTQFFDPIEDAKLAAAKLSSEFDEVAARQFRIGFGGLKRGASRAKRRDMMDFLAGAPAQKIAAAGRLSNEERASVNALKKEVFDPLAQRWFGTSSDDLFNNIIPRHRAVNSADASTVFAANEPISRGAATLLQFAQRNNAINPLERDLARFTASYIKTGFQREFVDAPLREAWQLTRSRNFPADIRRFSQRYLQGVDGTEGTFVRNFGQMYQDIFKAVGHDVPKEDVRNIVTGFTALTHGSLLGFKIGPLIRNALAGPTVSSPRIGAKWYLEGVKQSFTPKGLAIFKDSGIAQEQATVLDALNVVSRAPISGTAQQFAKTALWPYGKVDQLPRAHAFLGMRAKVLDAAKKLGANAPERDVLSKSGMYRFHPVHHPEFLKHWRAGEFEQAGRMAGVIANQDTQWIYRQGFRPQLLATEGGRFFGTFGIWPSNYLEYIKQMKDVVAGRWPGVPREEGVKWMAEWAAMNAAVVATFATTGAALGIGPEALQHTLGWTFLGPLAYGGAPAVDVVMNMGGMLNEMQQGRVGQHSAEVARTFGDLIPGQAALNDLLQTQGKQFRPTKGIERRRSTRRARTPAEAVFRGATGIRRKRRKTEFFGEEF